MPEINMKELWQRFRVGDPTTDAELLALHRQTDMVMDYFDDRGTEMHLVSIETNRIKSQIEDYLRARGYDISFDQKLKKIVVGKKCPANACCNFYSTC